MKMISDERELDKIYKRRDRYEIPDWQRDEVWDTPRKQALIDSILRGWKLPKFYFVLSGADPATYDVVDGQQRLSTIFEFLDNELELSDETAEEFGGKTYKALPPDISDRVDDFKIDFDLISEATDKDLMTFFLRLQNGLQLNSSEKLNAIQSKLKSFCRKMAKHEFFSKKVGFADKRYAYFDVVAKVATLEVEGFGTGLRLSDVKRVFEAQSNFSDQSQVAKGIKSALDFLASSIQDKSKIFRSRSLTQSFITLICYLQNGQALKGKESVLAEFARVFVDGLAAEVEKGQAATDTDFIIFQKSVNANVRSGPIVRHQVLLRKLFEFSPNFLTLVEKDVVESANFSGEISSVADDLTQMMSDINEVHASKHGTDLFKATNKTVKAQQAIGQTINSFETYKDFVGHLYFLFWEGPGSKMSDKPASFKDINVLRTELQHDTDHGDFSSVRKKKIKHGEVFQKYSGATSPVVAAPKLFPLVQLSILKAVRNDLVDILNAS